MMVVDAIFKLYNLSKGTLIHEKNWIYWYR